ncbi:MAG TPA: DUF1153 domain-containing protein [Micropepsaceae bacterium]|nr:DUF1153 domain-containing protein [Micropepsaceae bacterium]
MAHDLKPTFKYARRPDGTLLTPGNLPPASLRRWVMRHKADVVMAVGGGIITMEAACERYGLTREEFLSWKKAFEHFGTRGLSVRGGQQMQKIRKGDKNLKRQPEPAAADSPPSSSRDEPGQYTRPKLAHGR